MISHFFLRLMIAHFYLRMPVPFFKLNLICNSDSIFLSIKICSSGMFPHWGRLNANFSIPIRAATKISSCRIHTTSRHGIKQLRISFGSIFLQFSYESSQWEIMKVSVGNPRPPPLNDSPANTVCSNTNNPPTRF